MSSELERVTEAVVRRARQQGSILPREVREELDQAGLPGDRWKDVIALARPSLRYRAGRYYASPEVSERARRDLDQKQAVKRAVKQMIKAYRDVSGSVERREEDRVDFIQSAMVRTEDRQEYHLLSRDVSATGIRLIGTRRLLGQKVYVTFARPAIVGGPVPTEPPWTFLVRVLWTCAIGDELFENGGTFLEMG